MTKGLLMFATGIAAALFLGWMVFPNVLYKTEAQPLRFSHAVHAGEQVGLACADCHAVSPDGRFHGIPAVAKCAECHASAIGETADEKILVDEYVTPGREIPWKVYSRQPDNAYFPHAVHVTLAQIPCADCHGPQGASDSNRVYQVNRISGYSRDIWGPNISGIPSHSWEGMKMDRCVRCHEARGRRDGCIDCHK
jgi:hypothetical protein